MEKDDTQFPDRPILDTLSFSWKMSDDEMKEVQRVLGRLVVLDEEANTLRARVAELKARAEQAEKRMVEAYQIFGVLDAELDLFDDSLILDVFSRPDDKREVLPFELPARAQTLLAIVRTAEEETEAEDIYAAANLRELQHLRVALGEKTNARRAAVQAHREQDDG